MNEYFLYGISLGLAAGIAPGPLLSLVISETLRGGRLNGLLIALAPLITDLPIVLISIFLLHKLSGVDLIMGALSLTGGIFLIFLAYKNLKLQSSEIGTSSNYSTSIKYGVITNLLSPHPYLFWISVGAPTYIKASKHSTNDGIIFIAAFYLLLIGSKAIVAILTSLFSNFTQGKTYLLIIKALGLILLLIGSVMIYDGIKVIFFKNY